jgi:outer membrane usher protein FimD/PapC
MNRKSNFAKLYKILDGLESRKNLNYKDILSEIGLEYSVLSNKLLDDINSKFTIKYPPFSHEDFTLLHFAARDGYDSKDSYRRRESRC